MATTWIVIQMQYAAQEVKYNYKLREKDTNMHMCIFTLPLFTWNNIYLYDYMYVTT